MVQPDVTYNVDFGVNKVGVFANAFRIVPDTSDEFFLDFVVLSASDKVGTIVARVRVNKALLPAIQQRFEGALQEIRNQGSSAVEQNPIVLVLHKDDDKVN